MTEYPHSSVPYARNASIIKKVRDNKQAFFFYCVGLQCTTSYTVQFVLASDMQLELRRSLLHFVF
jgi:hypothetical protein